MIQSFKADFYERIEWLKEKGYYLLIVILISTTIFILTVFAVATLLFIIQPEDYRAETFPEFQTKNYDGYKLIAVLQNSFLKSKFCSLQSQSNTGRSINQQQFCNFNYQQLPSMHNPFDVILYGLNPLEVRYTTVCLLKFPRNQISHQPNSPNQSQSKSEIPFRNRYVCQKYRAYNKLHIINKMQTDELIFMEIELQLTEKGYESLQFLNLKLEFEQGRGRALRFIIDNYFWISGLISLGSGTWAAIVCFVLGVGYIVKITLQRKQERQQEMLASRFDKKKKR